MIGLPVASTITSMSASNSASASGRTAVVRSAIAASMSAATGFGRPVRPVRAHLRAFDVDVGDADDVDAGDVARLRQVHGPEPAGADQTHADGPSVAFALGQEFVQIHGLPFKGYGAVPEGVQAGLRLSRGFGGPALHPAYRPEASPQNKGEKTKVNEVEPVTLLFHRVRPKVNP